MAVNISSFLCDGITDVSTKDLVDEETCNTDDWLANFKNPNQHDNQSENCTESIQRCSC